MGWLYKKLWFSKEDQATYTRSHCVYQTTKETIHRLITQLGGQETDLKRLIGRGNDILKESYQRTSTAPRLAVVAGAALAALKRKAITPLWHKATKRFARTGTAT